MQLTSRCLVEYNFLGDILFAMSEPHDVVIPEDNILHSHRRE
jgi:hypothetical protein